MSASTADTSGTRLISHDGRGNQIAEQFPRGGTVTVAYDGHARLTRYRNGGASQTMLYNGMDERIQVVTTPAIGLADTRVYLYDLDHRIVGEYGATGTSDIKADHTQRYAGRCEPPPRLGSLPLRSVDFVR
jgi:YD repeat-containing protein